MGTNWFYRFDECGHCDRYTEVHVCKSKRTWRAYRNVFLDDEHPEWGRTQESPFGFSVRSLADWRTVFTARPGRLFDEYGKQIDDPLGWLGEAVPWRPTPEGLADLCADEAAGMGWLDEAGHRFYAGEFS
uniref:hypothetical protein n=1 Tax=Paractinoplanes polyasparticus TaxID=2856853 RepID=UPI001C852E9F|nr:hypothetical protein [Actinoplanes polyasparticus]